MRVAALYDVHGNLPALEAVLAAVDAESVDLVLVGGDVACGPMPRDTLDLLRALGENVRFLRGNADRAVVEGGAGEEGEWAARAAWCAEEVGAEGRRFLAHAPPTLAVDVDDLGRVLFCHGSPRSDEEILTAVTPEERLREVLAGVEERLVVCGHTHHQFDRRVDSVRVVNAGSVGIPYEDETGAYWVLLGPDVSLRRTAYDVEAAATRMRATGYPEVEMFVREYILSPGATAAEAAEAFEKIAVERGHQAANFENDW